MLHILHILLFSYNTNCVTYVSVLFTYVDHNTDLQSVFIVLSLVKLIVIWFYLE